MRVRLEWGSRSQTVSKLRLAVAATYTCFPISRNMTCIAYCQSRPMSKLQGNALLQAHAQAIESAQGWTCFTQVTSSDEASAE